jgi:mercuric ion transport protein
VGPILLLLLGASGAWAGSLAAFAKYRPLFIGIAAFSLVFSFYRIYRRPPAEACEPGGECEGGKTKKIQKIVLWTVTIFVAGVIAVPYLVPGVMTGKGGFREAREICRTGFKSSKFTVGRVFKGYKP